MTEVRERRFHVYVMATSIAVVPEKFDCGDFLRWLRNFDCCARANGWNDEKKLTVLPAFLRGQASSYFHTLKDDKEDTYEHLTSALRKCFCPKVAREQHYHEFEQRALRPNEDPSLFLWGFCQLLDRADPDLTEDAKTALLSRQFMKGLPSMQRLRLLDSDPTPTLAKMTEFVHHFRAIRCDETHGIAAVCSSSEEHDSPHASLLHSVNQLTAAVAALTSNQAHLKATVEEQHQQQLPSMQSQSRWRKQTHSLRRSQQLRCYNCNQVGNFARDCPWDIHCSVCRCWGHDAAQCANNFRVGLKPQETSLPVSSRPQENSLTFSVPSMSKSFPNSLNFKGVPQ